VLTPGNDIGTFRRLGPMTLRYLDKSRSFDLMPDERDYRRGPAFEGYRC
jgi:hypothetical protein